jgi:hypothetical protein
MKSKQVWTLLLGALGGSLALSSFASSVDARATQRFTAHIQFAGQWSDVGCAQPLAPGADDQKCIGHTAAPLVSGLGPVSLSFTAWQTSFGDCVHLTVADGSIVISGKGTLRFGGTKTGCAGKVSDGILKGQVPVAVTGGDGDFLDASGQGTLAILSVAGAGTGAARRSTGDLALALDLPNGSFDVTPPTIAGATARTVRVRRTAKRVRVTYRVTAQDAVDGPVLVVCTPRSGTLFRVGRTTVTCSAKDRSANTATAHFTITVARPKP